MLGDVGVSIILVGSGAGGVGIGLFVPLLALGDVGGQWWHW